MKYFTKLALLLLFACYTNISQAAVSPRGRWTPEQAKVWHAKQPWLAGCNFSPSTAINQLEMWQGDTWDPTTIDRELGWAQDLGFTSVRVFLHDLVWKHDRQGLLQRMEKFLQMADRHKIGVMFVLFDGVWDPFPKYGKQREPRPHVHNSGWVQSPGADMLKDPAARRELKAYVQGVIGHFRDDPRVQVWDVFNEPDNPVPQYQDVELKNKADLALALLKDTFQWGLEVNPLQPLTSGVWIGNWGDETKLSAMERCQLEGSDVITFHNYGPLEEARKCVENLRRYQRPILCTEYMARPQGSRFEPILGYFKTSVWGLTTGVLWMAKPKPSTRGIPGGQITPPNRQCGFTIFSVVTARLTTQKKPPISSQSLARESEERAGGSAP